ncbi:hypothetical protein ACG98H_03875 [Corynebacterium sp. L4756]|uniref:hypothetical protein n=1 Tax=unclassified Corynebacterium TaxID=2624378 RepID=UPI00374DC988
MPPNYHPEQAKLLWDTALGFVGFMAAVSMLQAIMNVFAESPAIWPGFVAAGLIGSTWLIYRAKKKYFQRYQRPYDTESSEQS